MRPYQVQDGSAHAAAAPPSGYSHGGNGFEGMAFLLEQFKGTDLKDPSFNQASVARLEIYLLRYSGYAAHDSRRVKCYGSRHIC
jgi:hypothetical protein